MPSSGGPIKQFSGGWALFPFNGQVAHLWDEKYTTSEGGLFRSRCGIDGCVTPQVPALEQGDFTKCKRCTNSR